MKRTKIVATIGPASEKQKTLEVMMKAGMNVCRLNMSHGTYAWHSRAIRTILKAAKKVKEPIAILLDLQGPKARIGELGGKSLPAGKAGYELRVGRKVIFTTQSNNSITHNPITKIPIAVPSFHEYVKKGSHLLIADGTIECVVEEVRGRDIHARVTLGGELKSHKGIAIAGVSLPLPSLTEKDKKDIAWGIKKDIDFVALSFVKTAADVMALRKLLTTPNPSSERRGNVNDFPPLLKRVEDGLSERKPRGSGGVLQMIVKIETREAIDNFDEILAEADGIMVARGDLAIATSPEEVPLFQKEIVEKCRRAAKPVIVATEMLASMERSPRPTRAEASDVANAVIDHTDATMLSGESAGGQFPVEAVSTMASIIERTEESRFDDLSISMRTSHGTGEEEAALIASVFARTGKASAIVAGSLTGHTGRLLSRYRTEVPLFLGSPARRVVRQLSLSWGIQPFLISRVKSMDTLLKILLQYARYGVASERMRRGASSRSLLRKGNKVIFLGSEKMTPHGQNFVGMRTL